MKLYFLGTCAGTEPMPGRKHASVAVEENGQVYWFDAGEGCSYTAHNIGVDLLAVKRIVLSHCHMDHVGGLGNLLWNIRKMTEMQYGMPKYGDIEVYIPVKETFEGLMMLLKNTESGFKCDFGVNCNEVHEGVLFEDENLSVTAFHNSHLRYEETDKPRSYSYRIDAGGKSLVYSGDIGKFADLDAVVGSGADAIIIETGHFKVDSVCDWVEGKNIGKIFFSHNGREILNHPLESEEKVKNRLGDRGVICYDTMTVEV